MFFNYDKYGSLREDDYSLHSESMCGGQELLLHRAIVSRYSGWL
jgi:hypothetical protein